MLSAEIIQENCPLFTEVLESLSKPKQLGAERTRHLYTYVYGLHINGYYWQEIANSANIVFRLNLNILNISEIIDSIELETRIASMILEA